jgi:CBS domain-containing protein
LAAGQPLDRALAELVRHDGGGLPVVETDRGQVAGWLGHRDVLAAYARAQDGGPG